MPPCPLRPRRSPPFVAERKPLGGGARAGYQDPMGIRAQWRGFEFDWKKAYAEPRRSVCQVRATAALRERQIQGLVPFMRSRNGDPHILIPRIECVVLGNFLSASPDGGARVHIRPLMLLPGLPLPKPAKLVVVPKKHARRRRTDAPSSSSSSSSFSKPTKTSPGWGSSELARTPSAWGPDLETAEMKFLGDIHSRLQGRRDLYEGRNMETETSTTSAHTRNNRRYQHALSLFHATRVAIIFQFCGTGIKLQSSLKPAPPVPRHGHGDGRHLPKNNPPGRALPCSGGRGNDVEKNGALDTGMDRTAKTPPQP